MVRFFLVVSQIGVIIRSTARYGCAVRSNPAKLPDFPNPGSPDTMIDSLHLDHAQRPQGVHHALGMRPALPRAPDRHRQGEQFEPEFVAISPNSKIPALPTLRAPTGSGPDVRIRRDSRVPLGQTGQFLPQACAASTKPCNG